MGRIVAVEPAGSSLSKHASPDTDVSCYEVTKKDEASRRMWHCSWVTQEATVSLGRRIAILRVRCAWKSGNFSCMRNLKSLKKGVSRTEKEYIWANTLATVEGQCINGFSTIQLLHCMPCPVGTWGKEVVWRTKTSAFMSFVRGN